MVRGEKMPQPSNLVFIGEVAHKLKSRCKTKKCFDWGGRRKEQIDGVIRSGFKAYCSSHRSDQETRGRWKPLSNEEEASICAIIHADEEKPTTKTGLYKKILVAAQSVNKLHTQSWTMSSARNFDDRHLFDFEDCVFKKVLIKNAKPTSSAVCFNKHGSSMFNKGKLGPLNGTTPFHQPFLTQYEKEQRNKSIKMKGCHQYHTEHGDYYDDPTLEGELNPFASTASAASDPSSSYNSDSEEEEEDGQDQSFDAGSSLVAAGTWGGTSSAGFMGSSGSDQLVSFLSASDRDHLIAEVKHLLSSGGLIGDQSFDAGSSLVAADTWGGTSSAGFMGSSGSDQLVSFLRASDRDHLIAEVKHLLGSGGLIGDQSFESGSSLVADGTWGGTSSAGFMVGSSGSDQLASFLSASDRDHLAAEVKHLLGSGGLIG
jgi:hypothetical protein